MKERKPHLKPWMKYGVGQHIYLMFASSRHRRDLPELSLKSGRLQRFISACLLIGVACMIGIVLWRQISGTH